MSKFSYTTDEIMKGDPATFVRELSKFLPDPNSPVATTASLAGGTEDFLSTLSVGQVLMGIPAVNSDTYVSSIQDKAFTSLTAAAVQSNANGGIAGSLQVKGQTVSTPFDYLLPGDISQDAKDWVANPASSGGSIGSGAGVDGSSGTSASGSTSTTGLPATSSAGPTNLAFLDQCRAQFGRPYLAVNPQRFGPQYFDCSGYVYTALRTIGITDPQMPTVSGNDSNGGGQWQWCANHHLNITVDQAIGTPGALLFVWNHHVAVSDGLGNAYQAVGHAYLSGSYPARNWGLAFDRGGLVPGMQYLPLPVGSSKR